MTTATSQRLKLAAAGLLLALGGSIYILFRSHTLLYQIVGDGWPWLEALRSVAADTLAAADTLTAAGSADGSASGHTAFPLAGVLTRFTIYSLPGALWSAAYILLIDACYTASAPVRRLRRAAAVPFIGAASELLQAFCPESSATIGGIRIGTFDTADLACYLVPLIIYSTIRLYPRETKR